MVASDLAFAFRTLRKNPAFTFTAVFTIALGIGASTAIFSVVNGVLLRPLPYAHADRLALIQTDMRARNIFDFPWGPGDIPDLRQQATAFGDIAGILTIRSAFAGVEGRPEQVTQAIVTPTFFTVLGARIGFGRNFAEPDGLPDPTVAPPTGAAVTAAAAPTRLPTIAVLSHSFWQRRFGGDSSVIGRSVQLNGATTQIVGVAAPDVRVVFPAGSGIQAQPDIYTALRIDWSTASRNNVFLHVIGRLAPGATFSTAQRQLDRLAGDLRDRFPIKKAASLGIRAEPMQADIVKNVRPAILALMGAVIFVLLIACANVANLLLVRAAAREREMAVRSALGGNRRVLVGQMLAESLVLGGAGGALGLLFAEVGIALLLAIAPVNIPRVTDVGIDPTVLAFTALAALGSALVFGMLPALRASRPNLAQTLRAGGRTPGLHSGKYLRQGVVVAEVALSFVLLTGSGLMLRSFMALQRVDPGFDPAGILTFTAVNPNLKSAGESRAYVQTLSQRLAAIPGVQSVTAASPLPLDGQDINMRWGTVAAASDPSLFRQATLHIVLPGYFAAMKTKLIAGHAFAEADNDTATTGVIIDNLLAAKAFPNQIPQSIIGKQMFCRINTPEAKMYQVVGIVEHERHLTLAEPGREAMFVPDGMFGFNAANRWAVRTTGDPSRLIPEVRAAVNQVDALVPVGEIQPMTAFVDRAMAPTRFSLVLIAIFGLVAAALAAVGLYGVLSTTVRQRTAEIGVRMAFGATSANIFRLIVGQGLVLSTAGIAAGIAAALALTGVMDSARMLVAVAPTDPATYAGIALLFVLIACVACWIPARRAARLDPNAALREE
jgi:predicted permease